MKVVALDIETSKTNFNNPQSSEVFLIGTKEYNVQGRQKKKSYRWWHPKDIRNLTKYLERNCDLIIGHNILKFDYRVLSSIMDPAPLCAKTVDTLALCWWKKNPHIKRFDVKRFLSWTATKKEIRHLGLDNLSSLNLGSGKSLTVNQLRYWIKRKSYKAIMKYNEIDCSLTIELWKYIKNKIKIKITEDRYIYFSPKDESVIMGHSNNLRGDEWRVWSNVEWEQFDKPSIDYLPIRQCLYCRGWDSIYKCEIDIEEISEGQLADYMIGLWGAYECHHCGCILAWDEDGWTILRAPNLNQV